MTYFLASSYASHPTNQSHGYVNIEMPEPPFMDGEIMGNPCTSSRDALTVQVISQHHVVVSGSPTQISLG